MFEGVKKGINTAWSVGSGAWKANRAAAAVWRGVEIRAEVENPRAFFNKKRLARMNADLLHKGFRLRYVEGAALLRRRSINLSPETCVDYLRESFPGVSFLIVKKTRRFGKQ